MECLLEGRQKLICQWAQGGIENGGILPLQQAQLCELMTPVHPHSACTACKVAVDGQLKLRSACTATSQKKANQPGERGSCHTAGKAAEVNIAQTCISGIGVTLMQVQKLCCHFPNIQGCHFISGNMFCSLMSQCRVEDRCIVSHCQKASLLHAVLTIVDFSACLRCNELAGDLG